MKRVLLVLFLIAAFTQPLLAQEIEETEKKTLFIFPIQWGDECEDAKDEYKSYTGEKFFEVFVTTFERFDFIDVQGNYKIESFLENANTFVEKHAQEFVQKRKEPDGRIGEARVTIDDLINTVEGSYAFVPVFDRVDKNTDKEGDVSFVITGHIDVYQTSTSEHVETVGGTTIGIGGLMGMMGSLGKSQRTDEDKFQHAMDGVLNEMKTNMRKLDIFSLKAKVTDTGGGKFGLSMGADYGVRMDNRFYVVAYQEGGGERMVAFGKVRKIEDNKAFAQVLLGGGVTEGDQVVEKAAFGININPYIGMVPLEIDGFIDDDFNTDGSTLWAGLIVEYNIGQFTNISELYPVVEVGLVSAPEASAYNANIGIAKKFYFRNIAVFGVAKYGMIELSYDDLDDEDAIQIWGLGLEVGAEFMFHPNAAVQARMGYAAFAETDIVEDYATAKASGLTFRAGLMFTL